jgi:hypothetical protein
MTIPHHHQRSDQFRNSNYECTVYRRSIYKCYDTQLSLSYLPVASNTKRNEDVSLMACLEQISQLKVGITRCNRLSRAIIQPFTHWSISSVDREQVLTEQTMSLIYIAEYAVRQPGSWNTFNATDVVLQFFLLMMGICRERFVKFLQPGSVAYQHAISSVFYERPGGVTISPAGVKPRRPRRQISPWAYDLTDFLHAVSDGIDI